MPDPAGKESTVTKVWKLVATIGLLVVWPIAVLIDFLTKGTAAEKVNRALRDLRNRPGDPRSGRIVLVVGGSSIHLIRREQPRNAKPRHSLAGASVLRDLPL